MRPGNNTSYRELSKLAPYIREHAWMLLLGFVFIFIQNFGLVRIPAYMKKMLDEIVKRNRFEIISELAVKIFVFTLLVAVSLYLMRRIIIGISRKIEYKIRSRLFSKLLCFEYDFFLNNETGDISSRVTNDLNDVRTLLGPGMMYIPNSVSRIIFFLPVLAGLSGSLVLMISPFFILLVFLILKFIPALRPKFKKIQETTAEINNMVWQTVSGITTIKQNGLEDNELKRFTSLNRTYIGVQMSMIKYRSLIRPMFIFLFSLIEIIILYFGGSKVISGTMTIGELLQFNIMVSALMFPVLSLGWILSMFQLGISAMGRINLILNRSSKIKNMDVKIESGFSEIKIKNLNFNYPGDSKIVINGLSLNINNGEVIGVTGSVGSGKSTLLNIISGLLIVENGKVLINGLDINTINRDSLSGLMSVVTQNPFLFSGTVKENIAITSDKPDMEKVRFAASAASLESDIDKFPDGYEQIVGERGITLSGGQKQRVALARAIYKSSSVLILDDPLSSVDSKTESQILSNLKRIGDGDEKFKTVVLVSHRISALKNCDRIIVLKNGKVSETGTHRGLINKKRDYFRLAEIQKLRE